VRSGEAIGARWDEIDLARSTWSIPGTRMKAGKEHVVPLSKPALAVLRQMQRTGRFVFTGRSGDRPIASSSLNALLKRMGRGESVHGMRSSFRTFCQERTDVPREIAEMALAHKVMDATEAAYARSDVLSKRARLMADWARWCTTPRSTAKVIEAKRRRK
jgi:integrase